MEPRYLTYVVAANFVVVGNRGSSDRSVMIGGWHIRVSSYPVRGNPALCWQRSGLVLGTSFQRRFHVAMGSSLAWPFVGNPIPNTKPCTVLVVEPIIHLWWRPTVWMVAIVGISAKCLCWLRFISLLSKWFFLHYALVIISNVSF